MENEQNEQNEEVDDEPSLIGVSDDWVEPDYFA
jgi:hypothetical protein